MAFKDKKEEVIEIEMTSFGKNLLSKGKFKPVYYAFFDDDIMYDAQYAGEAEEQNYAQTRILEETPRLAVQTNYLGLETEVKKQIEEARTQKKMLKDSFQSTKERHYALTSPLGKASVSTDYYPSWDITLYGSTFDSQEIAKTGDEQSILIPQMNLSDLTYLTKVVEVEEGKKYDNEYNNGRAIEITENDFIVEIDELHTDSLRENYDIEVFIVEEATENGMEVENLQQLFFRKDIRDNVVDGILIDEVPNTNVEDIDETYVEFYLDIDIDRDIEVSKLCKLGYRTDFSKRGYIRVECDEGAEGATMDQVYDPFAPPVDPFGDDC